MKRSNTLMAALGTLTLFAAVPFLTAALPSQPAHAQEAPFGDVTEQHVNVEALDYLKDSGVIQGYNDGNFRPEHRINRAEFTKIVIEAKYGKAEIDGCVAKNVKAGANTVFFPDVPANEWFAKYVCMAKVNSIVAGYPDGTFKPGDRINFAEASKIITETLDVDTSDTSGTGQEWFAGYIRGLEKKSAIPSSVQFFDKEITRGEMAETIWRLKADREDKVTGTYAEISNPLPAIASCEALEEKFANYYKQNYYRYDYLRRGGVMLMSDDGAESVAPQSANDTDSATKTTSAPSGDANGGSGAAEEYSQTNVQVAGVDEADVVKNDGQYIYMVKSGTVKIVAAYPPTAMAEVSTVDFAEDGFYAEEMFVDKDTLTIIGRVNPYIYSNNKRVASPLIMPPHLYRSQQTRVYVMDIRDRTKPKETRAVSFDGYYQSSRRIGNQLYLVMNAHPDYWALDELTKGGEIVPMMKDGEREAEAMVGCGDIRYFPGYDIPRYLSIASIPLDDPDGEIGREVLLGSSENIYSSRTHLYVASSEVNYNHYSDWDWRQDNTRTLVFRFSLEDGEITFRGRGKVPGNILNQFSMDAHRDHFRIATTIGNTWDEENLSTNNVYVLDGDMKTVGSLEGLAPGERIYSTRFLGDRLYMVTFKQVDPLFVIDLATPTAPKLLGKLKIPGFSEYLHPFDANHIIGFGKDTVEEEKERTVVAGMRMGMFDVSDVENPKQKFVEIIGDRGTYSELMNNHKALLFDKEKSLLAFPIRIQERVVTEDLVCGQYRYNTCPIGCQKRCIPTCTENELGVAVCENDCNGLGSCQESSYDQYETTLSGAIVYDVSSENGFSERGRITHYTAEDLAKLGDYWPYDGNKEIQRIIYIGNYLYTISQGLIKASGMTDVKEVGKVEISGGNEAGYPEVMPLMDEDVVE